MKDEKWKNNGKRENWKKERIEKIASRLKVIVKQENNKKEREKERTKLKKRKEVKGKEKCKHKSKLKKWGKGRKNIKKLIKPHENKNG